MGVAGIMTLDEMIEREKIQANNMDIWRKRALICKDTVSAYGFQEDKKYHEQLVSFLEELKAIKENERDMIDRKALLKELETKPKYSIEAPKGLEAIADLITFHHNEVVKVIEEQPRIGE